MDRKRFTSARFRVGGADQYPGRLFLSIGRLDSIAMAILVHDLESRSRGQSNVFPSAVQG